MKKIDKINRLLSIKDSYDMCRCYFKYDDNYFYYYVLDVSNKFLLGLEEDDFITDGFQIRKISDLKKVEIRDDACPIINKENKLLENLVKPNINITSWHDVFVSLKERDKIIIVEDEYYDKNKNEFAIGRILKVNKSNVILKVFDPDGNYYDGILEIPFRYITSVTFNSRYTNYWEKYLNKKDNNK